VTTIPVNDGPVVTSYRARETDTIITADGAVRNAGYEILWK
jgi:hypothetical protein